MTDSAPDHVTSTAPETGTTIQQASPCVQISLAVPHGIPLSCQIAVVVGYVHLRLTYRALSRVLGYRALNIPYRQVEWFYTTEKVKDVFVYLKEGALNGRLKGEQNIYSLWGPDYDAVVEDELRIRGVDIEYQKSLILEALQRTDFIKSVQDFYEGELENRRKIWRRLERLGDAEWREEDEEEVLWNGLAERETDIRSPVETVSTISTESSSIQESDWESAVSKMAPSVQQPEWELDAEEGSGQPIYPRDRRNGRRGPGSKTWLEIPTVPGYVVSIKTRKVIEDTQKNALSKSD